MLKHLISSSLALVLSTALAQTPEKNQLSNLDQTGISKAWIRGYTGRGITVGVIDQGFDLRHTDLVGRVITSSNFTLGGPASQGLHGTAMASIIAGNANNTGTIGAAPDAKLLLAQVGSGGSNLAMNTDAIARSLNWLSQSGASVINMSFGADFTSGFIQSVKWDARTKTYIGPKLQDNSAAYVLATGRGSILVASAGNQGLPYSQVPATYAVATNNTGQLILGGRAIIVGAVDRNNQIASFSNRAGHLCQNQAGSSCLDHVPTMNYFVVAPGVNIVAATGNQSATTLTSGTSAAAAYVSGGLALMRQAWPHLRPEQLVNLLLATTRDLGIPGVDTIYGRGLVDFDRATQPTGQLVLANANTRLNGGAVTGTALTNTALTGGITLSFTSNSVLKNIQSVDQIGRNYALDLTKLLVKPQTYYDPYNPYLIYAMAQPIGLEYNDLLIDFMPGTNGSGISFSKNFNWLTVQYQFGSLAESQGFIGNYGSGAFQLGSSQTLWNNLKLTSRLTKNSRLVAGYAQGLTRVNNVSNGIIEINGPVVTNSYQIGLAFDNLLATKDNFSFGLASDIRIRSGMATVTAVTGFDYRETSGEIVADPIVTKEKIDLRQANNVLLWANYTRSLDKNSLLRLNLATNDHSYKIGLNLTWIQ